MSPSAFIPFCELGGNMSAMGVKIDQFDDPVCDSFQAKILNDQICYEVDLSAIKKENIDKELELGFSFLMDYNEDRQVNLDKKLQEKTSGFTSKIIEKHQDTHALIYLDTIGEIISSLIHYYLNDLCKRSSNNNHQ